MLFGSALYLGGAGQYSVGAGLVLALGTLAITGVQWKTLRSDRLVKAAVIVIAITALQTIPLPAFLARALDPSSAALTAGALRPFGIDRSASFRSLHLDPGNGIADLAYFVAAVAVYLASRQATERNQGRAIHVVALASTLAVALIALAHKLWSIDELYSFYRLEGALPPIIGPLLNPNHLAAFTGVGAILWLGESLDAEAPANRVMLAVAASLCGAVTVLSLSRGGVAATAGGILVTIALHIASKARRPQRSSTKLVGVALAVAGFVALSLVAGWEGIRTEYRGGDLSKIGLVLRSLRALRGHWLLGVGSGGLHAQVAALGLIPGRLTMERAECLPVDLAIAIGPVGAVAALVLVGRWFWRVRPSATSESYVRSSFCAVASLGLHDLTDFSLWLGGTGFLAAILAGLLAGSGAPSSASPRPGRHRIVMLLLAVLAVAMVPRIARASLSSARKRMAASTPSEQLPRPVVEGMLVDHPCDPYLPLAQGALAAARRDGHAFRAINRSIELSPSWSEPHRVLGLLLLQSHRSQAIVELRLAAENDPERLLAAAQALLTADPSPDEIRAALPRGPLRRQYASLLGQIVVGTPRSEAVDQILLEVDPDHRDALRRTAERARAAGDSALERSVYERLLRAQPLDPAGYIGLAALLGDGGDADGAERLLRSGLVRVTDREPIHEALAENCTRRGDVGGMRAEMQSVLDESGADVARRIRVLGVLGGFERRLGNRGAALASFERADAMALPEHPYLGDVIEIASELGDRPRVRAACGILLDEGHPSAVQSAACAAANRLAPGGAP